MKRSRLKTRKPLRANTQTNRDWRERSARKYEERLREEGGSRFRDLGRNEKRRKREWTRTYGSEERVEAVKREPCVGCGRVPCDNHHVRGGGEGRKADACWIVPLCETDPHEGREGCHDLIHRIGRASYEREKGVDLEVEARRIEGMYPST